MLQGLLGQLFKPNPQAILTCIVHLLQVDLVNHSYNRQICQWVSDSGGVLLTWEAELATDLGG